MIGPITELCLAEPCPRCGMQRAGYADARNRTKVRTPDSCPDKRACGRDILASIAGLGAFPAVDLASIASTLAPA